jgi:hypothetical protein
VIGIERHLPAPAVEATGERGNGGLRALYRRAVERWGRLAVYGGLTVACYTLFAILARGISFGRVEPGALLYLAIFAAGFVFVAMIALLTRILWVTLRGTADLADPAARRTILLTALLAGPLPDHRAAPLLERCAQLSRLRAGVRGLWA